MRESNLSVDHNIEGHKEGMSGGYIKKLIS